jgi:hypothetical protein
MQLINDERAVCAYAANDRVSLVCKSRQVGKWADHAEAIADSWSAFLM